MLQSMELQRVGHNLETEKQHINHTILSLHLRVYFCSANRFVSIIFLFSVYMRKYMVFVFLFLTYFSLYD